MPNSVEHRHRRARHRLRVIREPIPRLLPRRDWRWLWIVTLLATAALLVGLGAVACGKKSSSASTPTYPCAVDPASCAPPPPQAECTGTGLAAVDLSGTCRATPQATMGALEAMP
jgi:hypothetical protein